MDYPNWIYILILYLISFYDFYSCLNIGKIYCKITFDNKKLLLNLFVDYLISLSIIILSIFHYLDKNTNLFWIILGNSLFIIIIILDIINLKNYSAITSKGIYYKSNLIKWKYIKSYTYVDDNSLQINCVSYYDKKYTKIFKNLSISKEILNNIFKNHINYKNF